MQISGIFSKIKTPKIIGGLFSAKKGDNMRKIFASLVLFGLTISYAHAVSGNPAISCSECSDDVLEHSMPTNFTAADGKTYSNCNALCRAYQMIREVTPGDPNANGVYVYYEYTYDEICGTWNPGTQMGALGQCFLIKTTKYICGKGYYGNATSETSGCTKCPANATCTNGIIFNCNSGWYKNDVGNGCSPCPDPKTGPNDEKNWTVASSSRVGSTGIMMGQTGATDIGQCYLTNTSVVTDRTGTYEIEGATGGTSGKYCDYYGKY